MAFHRKLRKPTTVFDIHDVLYATLKVMDDRNGYVSKKTADVSGECPTSQFVLSFLKEVSISSSGFPDEIKQKYFNKVSEIITHFSQPPADMNDEFLRKVYEFFITRSVSDRMIGFIVALPSMYEHLHQRTSSLMKIAEKYSTSNYMGEIGVRDVFFVKLLDVQEFHKEDDNGVDQLLYIYRVSDKIGNIGFFFSKNPPVDNETSTVEKLPIKKFHCFEIKATVKKQMPNRDTGIKETQFTRVRIVEVVGEGTEE
jgi:hypothetical protein